VPSPVAKAQFAIALGGFGIGTTEFATMGLLPQISDGLHASIPETGYAITLYALGVVIGAPLIAALSAKLPRKALLIGLMVAFTIGNALSAMAPSIGLLLVARFVSGLPHGAYFGISAVVVSAIVPPQRRGRAVAMILVGLTLANVVGVPLTTVLGQSLGWRSAFVVVAVIGALTLLALKRWVPPVAAAGDASMTRELGALRRPQVWFALVTGMIGFGGMFALYSYITPTMTNVTGLGDHAIPWVLATFGAGMTVGILLGGRLIERSVTGTICGALVASALALAGFALTASHAAPAILFVFLVGLTAQVLGPALQVRLMDASPDAPSLAASSTHSALNIGNATGAWLGGLVIAAGWGYRSTAWVGVALSLAGLVIAGLSVAYDRSAAGAARAAGAEPSPVRR
jgi:DHA1 family inner membrane transport protein